MEETRPPNISLDRMRNSNNRSTNSEFETQTTPYTNTSKCGRCAFKTKQRGRDTHFPSSHAAGPSEMKNWLPFVSGPLFAMETMPALA
jgi:hypothetical protein